jgi:phage portal protein BeeE
MKDHILEMIDNNPAGLFNYKEDRILEKNLLGTSPAIQAEMENKLKAIIQSYNTRLLDNDMTVKTTHK